MKIGLIGINMYPKYLNFACGLHTYAFQQFLLQNGIDNTVIDYKPVYFDNFDMRHPADYYKSKFNKLKKKSVSSDEEKKEKSEKLADFQEKINDWDTLYDEREIRYDKFQKFIDSNYIKTEDKYDSDLLEIQDPGFDCYICVTDVIWNLLPDHTYDRGFFLASKAMEGKQKIAYAASRGVPKPYTDYEKKLFFHYIEDIDEISVREESLKDFVEENSDKEATLVLDPVLLHGTDFWQAISVKPQEKKYILLYYVMEKAADTIRRAVEYAKAHDLQIVEISDRPVKGGRVTDGSVKHISRYDVSMEEWLGYIEHAEYIFTNSFHGCCFAILFEKLFFVGNRKGDKVSNLLNIFDLHDRKMPNKNDPLDSVPQAIDYNSVGEILKEKRSESQNYILNAVNNAKKRITEKKNRNNIDYERFRKHLNFQVRYDSNKTGVANTYDTNETQRMIKKLPSGKVEFFDDKEYINDESSTLEKNRFTLSGYKFNGWCLCIQIDNRWFWYMKDGSLELKSKFDFIKERVGIFGRIIEKSYASFSRKKIMLITDEGNIPYIPVNNIRKMVAVADWKKL